MFPMDLLKAGQNRGALGEVERGDDLAVFQPLVDAELLADGAAVQHGELLVEFFLQLALPFGR
jgi:hypothetical protein